MHTLNFVFNKTLHPLINLHLCFPLSIFPLFVEDDASVLNISHEENLIHTGKLYTCSWTRIRLSSHDPSKLGYAEALMANAYWENYVRSLRKLSGKSAMIITSTFMFQGKRKMKLNCLSHLLTKIFVTYNWNIPFKMQW